MVKILQKSLKKLKGRKGFTLIELIVVIAILGILAAIIIPQFAGFQERAKSTQALVDAKQVATAIDGLIIEEKDLACAADTDNVIAMSGVTIAKGTITIAVPGFGDAGYKDGYFSYTTASGFTAERTAATGGKVQLVP